MNFPLFNRPGTIVFLDDDPDYLEMLSLMVPRKWYARLFTQPRECIAALQSEVPFWEADAWTQQQLVDQWRAGKPLVPQILDYWSRQTERFALTRLFVVDFSMPGMDGLQVLGELIDWPGARVLLTGQADDQVAINAFNAGLIEQFVPKQTADISRHFIEVAERLLATPHTQHAQTWRATLNPDQLAFVRDPGVSRDLARLAASRWVEHVLIGDPFGILGLDAAGSASWLQLEPTAGLHALGEIAQFEGMDAATVADIRAGRKLANLEVAQSLRLAPSLGDATPLGSKGALLGAFFSLETGPSGDAGYARWLARQPRRRIAG
ncbi:response regulator [Ramlibacter humi]|uniref:Response regulator n=1 Tax=Ramlibacter humi TaxID=2530451 RepID=A0A4Z0BKK4_9BURK|nr:response regulator [Ramlibacter humi]TFY98949.1 response regulator [Ramlibacter humi]